jgi:hypothetical protein
MGSMADNTVREVLNKRCTSFTQIFSMNLCSGDGLCRGEPRHTCLSTFVAYVAESTADMEAMRATIAQLVYL